MTDGKYISPYNYHYLTPIKQNELSFMYILRCGSCVEMGITVMSREHRDVWNPRQSGGLFNSMIRIISKKASKPRITCPLYDKSTDGLWISLTRDQQYAKPIHCLNAMGIGSGSANYPPPPPNEEIYDDPTFRFGVSTRHIIIKRIEIPPHQWTSTSLT